MNGKPTGGMTKADIIQWYNNNGYELPPGSGNKPPNKDQLLKHVDSIEHESTMPTYEIASAYGHEIVKTPPYQCEL
jgi:hypothetical protein